VHNNAEISYESRRVFLGGQEQVDVAIERRALAMILGCDVDLEILLRREAGSSHVSMLAR